MIRNAVSSALQNKNTVMFLTSIVFMAGILAYFNDKALLCSAIITLAALVVLIKNYISPKVVLFWIAIFYFGFFNSYFRIHNTDSLVAFAPKKAEITGQIVSIPNQAERGTKFFFNVSEINGNKISAKTLVTLSSEGSYNIGEYYKLKGKINIPFKATNPSQFDYGKYLRNFDAFTTFYANSAEPVNEKLSPRWKFMRALNNQRNEIIKVHSQYLKSPYLEILGGIVFGDDAVTPPDYVKFSFINSGLLHILAASGMNVAFIYGFWFFILNRLKFPYKFTVISGMGLVVLYTLMTGLGASVVRAALMLLIVLIGKLIDRNTHSVSLLSFVAFLMLIYNPAYINSVSFQLSFLVTFGILVTGTIVFERMGEKFPKLIAGELMIPVVAQIWVAPIQMFYFNTFSTYSIFANILIMPFLSVVSFGGFLSSILAISP